ncbi:MAG: nucleotide exchange factor GrpE [Magnetococcales bacterium]|nr:nucleotide exchange factor GrpE [Magnetococcales bacterium]
MEQNTEKMGQEPVVTASVADGEPTSVGERDGVENAVGAETVDAGQTESGAPGSADGDQLEDATMRFFGGAGEQAAAAKGADGPSLEAQLQAAQALAEEQRNACLRAVAEMQNARKRFERESQQARQYAVEGFARDLLTVADNLERALAAVPKECTPELKLFQDGVAMTQNELARAFGKHGVTLIKALHEPFDPNLHQAVFQVEETDAPAGTVVRELQSGYLLSGRLLRPAMVGVAKEKEPVDLVADTAEPEAVE